ncbi:hypothetical protein [Brevibacillus brevis]|uniref:hypothetical protein n=1 Tax=Brevibacillus brevis TaxID=1393 RepID=UPI00165D8148|nr:hypothetical protein [Brevibacillus brevis]
MNDEVLKHMSILQLLDEEYFLCLTVLKNNDIMFETDQKSYWLFKREDDFVRVEISTFSSFGIVRQTSYVNDHIIIQIDPTNYAERYRRGDLLFYVAEAFGDKVHGKKDTDIEWTNITRVFKVGERYLRFLGHNTELLMEWNPRSLNSEVCADTFYEFLMKVLVKLKENPNAVTDILQLRDDYKQFKGSGNEKLLLMLSGLENLSLKYRI